MEHPYSKTPTSGGSGSVGTVEARQAGPAHQNLRTDRPMGQCVEPRGLPAHVDPTELRRQLWHIMPGVLPFLLWPFPHRDPISPTLLSIMILMVVGIALRILVQYRLIARQGDQCGWIPVVGYAGSVLGMLLLFPAQAELGLTVLAVLAFGDGSATLAGLLVRGPKLPWNHEKTWAGSLCFLLVGAPLASIIYWGESHNLEALSPGVPWSTALICGVSATLAGAFAESLAVRINDNIRVGLAAAVAVVMVHGAVVGWF